MFCCIENLYKLCENSPMNLCFSSLLHLFSCAASSYAKRCENNQMHLHLPHASNKFLRVFQMFVFFEIQKLEEPQAHLRYELMNYVLSWFAECIAKVKKRSKILPSRQQTDEAKQKRLFVLFVVCTWNAHQSEMCALFYEFQIVVCVMDTHAL